jgi:hypothetical protein
MWDGSRHVPSGQTVLSQPGPASPPDQGNADQIGPTQQVGATQQIGPTQQIGATLLIGPRQQLGATQQIGPIQQTVGRTEHV